MHVRRDEDLVPFLRRGWSIRVCTGAPAEPDLLGFRGWLAESLDLSLNGCACSKALVVRCFLSGLKP